jgi:hypothetical protein
VYLRREHDADYLNARRWNECINAATPETQVLVQLDDVRLRPDLVRRHVSWHLDGVMRVVTGAKFEGDEMTWDLASCARGRLVSTGDAPRAGVPWTAVWGASLSYPYTLTQALRREPYERPFDERMAGWGFHEVEFACRAVKAGAEVVYDPCAGVFHRSHGPRNDAGRPIDHTRERARGGDRNARYVVEKHELGRLPRW